MDMRTQTTAGARAFALAMAVAIVCTARPAAALQGYGDSNLFALDTASASAVGPDTPVVLRYFVGPCSPNPFNPRTTIHYGVAARGPARLSVYDVSGRCVRVLLDVPDLAPGIYESVWDGHDDRGRAVASGVYLSQLRTGGPVCNALMVLVR
jgi:hypothetical protein